MPKRKSPPATTQDNVPPLDVPRSRAYAPFVMRTDEAAYYLNISPRSFHELAKTEGFPLPVSIHGSMTGWFTADIEAWMQGKREAAANVNSWD